MSGTPRIEPIAVLPGGRVFWNDGLAKTWLKPPPASIQPISRTPGLLRQLLGGETLSTPTPVDAFVHS